MLRNAVNLKNVIDIFAGVVGLVFDKLEGSTTTDGESAEADDLTEINGIGRAFAQRLNEAGILTYQQLADLTADQVREVTSAAQWQGDPAAWIAEAQALAES